MSCRITTQLKAVEIRQINDTPDYDNVDTDDSDEDDFRLTEQQS